MAGDWIVWRVGLTRKIEVLKIASRLKIAPAHAAGLVMQLMEWIDENVSEFDHDGNAHVTLGPLQSSALDVTLGVTGFMETLAEVGWLRQKDDELVFVHVGRHNGQTAKQRALTKNRVAAHRAVAAVTPPALPEKRREEKRTDIATAPPPHRARTRMDDLFDAIVKVTGVNPKAAGGEVGKARQAILAISPEVTGAEIERRAANYHQNHPELTMGPSALAKWWPESDKTNGNDQGRNSRSFSQRNDYSGVKNI